MIFHFYLEQIPKSGYVVSLEGLYEVLGVTLLVEIGDTFPEHESLSALILDTTHGPLFPKGSRVTVVRDDISVIVTTD